LRIVSTFVPGAIDPVWVFHTAAFARSFLVAVVESRDNGDSVDDKGQRALTFLRGYQDANHIKGQTTFVNVSSRSSIASLVRTTLSEAAGTAFVDGNAVVFYGPDADACKTMLTALGAPKWCY
jgi:hypothetical protein